MMGAASNMAMSRRTSYFSPSALRSWRKARNLAQSEVADLLGLSTRQFASLESGASPVHKALAVVIWLINEISTEQTTYEELKDILERFIETLEE